MDSVEITSSPCVHIMGAVLVDQWSVALSGQVLDNYGYWNFGGRLYFSDWGLAALLDELRVYRRALGTNELQAIYEAGKSWPEAGIVGGGGQSAGSGDYLPEPLAVAVSNAHGVVAGATVRFEVVGGTGLLSLAPDGVGLSNVLEVASGSNGLAQVYLRYGGGTELTNRVLAAVGPTGHVSQVAMEAYVDGDGDGMPDWWEAAHGSDPDVADPAGDVDGDGLSNLMDYGLTMDLVGYGGGDFSVAAWVKLTGPQSWG